MSKLAGHLLQTTPIVLAASLAAQQGVNATTVPPAASTETPSPASSEVVSPPPVAEPVAVAPAPAVTPSPPVVAVPALPPPAPEPVAIAVVKTPKPSAPQTQTAPPQPLASTSAPTISPTTVASVPESASASNHPPEPPVAPALGTVEEFKTVETEAAALQTQTPASSVSPSPQPLRSEVLDELDTGTLDAPTVAQPAIPDSTQLHQGQQHQQAVSVRYSLTTPTESPNEAIESPAPAAQSAVVDPTAVDINETQAQQSLLTPEVSNAEQWGTVQQETTLSTTPVQSEFVDLDPVITELENHPELAESVPPVPQVTIVEEFVDIDPAIAHLEELPLEAFDDLIIAIEQELEPPSTPTTSAQMPAGQSVEALAEDEYVDLDTAADWQPLPAQTLESLDELEREATELTIGLSIDELLKRVNAYSTGASNGALVRNEAEPESENTALTAEPSVDELLAQANAYSAEAINGSLGQGVLSASQFSDVFPSDWAYTALDDLVRRYDCIRGYPNGTFRGGRALSRYEFAAGLNACVQQVERLIAETTSDLATRADLEVLATLVREFETEINTLNNRVDGLETRVTFLEDNQFSTTTKLAGEVLFLLADLFTESQLFDDDYNGVINNSDTSFTGVETVFQNRVRLNLFTSFNGRDRLHTRLQARNASQFDPLNGGSNTATVVTNEGQWSFAGSSATSNVSISELNYRTPIGRQFDFQIAAVGLSADEIVNTLNPFDSSGGGAVSQFGQHNPIYRAGGNDAGIGLNFTPNDKFQLSVGYTNETASNPSSGVFNDGYNFISQATIQPNEQFAIAATFSHAYGTNNSGLSFSAGSRGANLNRSGSRGINTTGRPVVGNSYALEALVNVNEQLFVGGWVGYTWARVIDIGDADIWNYAGFLGVNDLGGEGNQLGVVVGMEPRLARADTGVGSSDRSVGLHIEGFYKIRVNQNIDITPGIIWLTAPDHNSVNPDLVAGVVRTRFKF
ncbi:MAG: iron uptake porin [Spirulina sp. SIO3F2]|nr:iron uptake porin [Spirulina sp. SIO3F2]